MIDRDKIIKGLKCCADDKPFYHAHCDKCPYNGQKPDNMGGCIKLYRDALELLKEQDNRISLTDEEIEEIPTYNGWISVKDRLPPAYDTCITAIKDVSGDTTFRYVYFGWYLPKGECWIIADEARTDVYAWMPLTKPPKEDGNESD